MTNIVIMHFPGDTLVAERLRIDLAIRQLAVTVRALTRTSIRATSSDTCIIVLAPHPGSQDFATLEHLMSQEPYDAESVLLVARDTEHLPPWVYQIAHDVLDRDQGAYDQLFERLFRLVHGDLPAWLDLRVRPTLMLGPTGIAWWDDDLFVADDRQGHVARIGLSDTTVVLPGLDEPHHISIDRRRLAVANTSAGEILKCDLVDGLASRVSALTHANRAPLMRPHDYRQVAGMEVVADTDRDRIFYKWTSWKSWREVATESPLYRPCGLVVDQHGIWIADTFNHRVVLCGSDGREVLTFGSRGQQRGSLHFPVGLARWGRYLFISDEANERIVVGACDAQAAGGLSLTHILSGLADKWMGQPFGLSVSRDNRLAVADRKKRCVWLIDLPALEREVLASST